MEERLGLERHYDHQDDDEIINSPIEESLARFWCQLLKGEHINAEDNFFRSRR